MEKIKVTRKTTESEMNVVLDFAPLKKDYRKYIKTPIPFLNHMIEHIAWRGEVNIDVDLKLDEFVLTHVICEDLGIALGKAAKEYIDRLYGRYIPLLHLVRQQRNISTVQTVREVSVTQSVL